MRKVAAVVVTYNRRDMLLDCIAALDAQSARKEMDIVVIDNASTDGTADAVRGFISDGTIIYRNTGANLGGAGGFSCGMKYAAEQGYEFIWVMDDDCMPEPDALKAFLNYESENHGTYGFLSSHVLWKDGTTNRMNLQRRTLVQNVRNPEIGVQRVAMASFVSLFVPTSIVKRLGLPIKEFFIWTDDWEFTRRISRSYPGYLLGGSRVMHKSAANVGADISTDSGERISRYRYLYRNDVVLYRREGIIGLGYEIARLSWHSLKIALKSDNKISRLKTVWGGSLEGLKFRPEVEFPENEAEGGRE